MIISLYPKIPRRHLTLPLITLLLALWALAITGPREARASSLLHHQLHVGLHPDTHTLIGVDRIQLPPDFSSSSISFILHPQLRIDRVEFKGQPLPIPQLPAIKDSQPPSTRRVVEIPLSLPDPPDQPAVLTLHYQGVIDDFPKSSGGLRFVRPDDTNGHIGTRGVYLTYETFWYPTWEDTLATFDLTLSLPADWEAITQGRQISRSTADGRRISQWAVDQPSEALTVAANNFVVHKQKWEEVELSAYFFPEEAHLAPQYLEAAGHYLRMYSNLLGPYPFSQFAIVENFFPSGLGLPSFTLLGQGVVKRGYTQPYSLGHEIVHSWFGNSVFNDYAEGNWVEGLTTYLSNYYYDEATNHHQEAFQTRRRMIHEYNLYAMPDKEYPVNEFHHKKTRIDNAIGYQKTALVFHMLRQEMGDAAFFEGVRDIVREGTGKYLNWNHLQQIFLKAAERNLNWFFQQWIDRPGAPKVRIQDVEVKKDTEGEGPVTLTGTIHQAEPVFRFRLPLHIELEGGGTHDTLLQVDQGRIPFSFSFQKTPKQLVLDPRHHLLLRLSRDQLPPMLNKWETDTRRILVKPQTLSPDEQQSLAPLFERLEGQPDMEILETDEPVIIESASYLIISPSVSHLLASKVFPICDRHVKFESGKISIHDHTFKGPEMAYIISCSHPHDADHTVTFFFGGSPEAVKPVSRLLFFYGWDSYLIFQHGKIIARGMFQPVHSAREFTIPVP